MTKLQDYSVKSKSAEEIPNFEGNQPISLKTIFRKNGIGYRLIKRNNNLALFELSTDRHWEIDRIYIAPANDRFGKHFPEAETISNENQFGKDGSRTFQNIEKALIYYDQLSKTLGCSRHVADLIHIDAEVDICTIRYEIVPPSEYIPSREINKTDAVRLPEAFGKNELNYNLIKRNDKVGLFEINVGKILCSYEVVRIKVMPDFTIKGNHFPVREAITTNDEFGMDDGSKCFFANEPERAIQYFENLSAEIRAIDNGSTEHFYTNKYSI